MVKYMKPVIYHSIESWIHEYWGNLEQNNGRKRIKLIIFWPLDYATGKMGQIDVSYVLKCLVMTRIMMSDTS